MDITQTHISFSTSRPWLRRRKPCAGKGADHTRFLGRAPPHMHENNGCSVNTTIRYMAERHTHGATMLSFRFPFLP
jgi:hypothetical protein